MEIIMPWFILFALVKALDCDIDCLTVCELNLTTSCIKSCCPSILLTSDGSCSVTCENIGGKYECKDFCVSQTNSCSQNCENFCKSRSNSCTETCYAEFCETHNTHYNYLYALGAAILFISFVTGLYLKISEINSKLTEISLENIN